MGPDGPCVRPPPPQPPRISVRARTIRVLISGTPVSSLLPPLDSQFNPLTSVLISLCRLFADFTRHNFYQLALKRDLSWALLPVLERGPSPGRGAPAAACAR